LTPPRACAAAYASIRACSVSGDFDDGFDDDDDDDDDDDAGGDAFSFFFGGDDGSSAADDNDGSNDDDDADNVDDVSMRGASTLELSLQRL
jgi:hypothetical protein